MSSARILYRCAICHYMSKTIDDVYRHIRACHEPPAFPQGTDNSASLNAATTEGVAADIAHFPDVASDGLSARGDTNQQKAEHSPSVADACTTGTDAETGGDNVVVKPVISEKPSPSSCSEDSDEGHESSDDSYEPVCGFVSVGERFFVTEALSRCCFDEHHPDRKDPAADGREMTGMMPGKVFVPERHLLIPGENEFQKAVVIVDVLDHWNAVSNPHGCVGLTTGVQVGYAERRLEPPMGTPPEHSLGCREPVVEEKAGDALGIEGPSVAQEQIAHSAAEDDEPSTDSPIQWFDDTLSTSEDGASGYLQDNMVAPASGPIRIMAGAHSPSVVASGVYFDSGCHGSTPVAPAGYLPQFVCPRIGPTTHGLPMVTPPQHSPGYQEPNVGAQAEFAIGIEGPSGAQEQIANAAAGDTEPLTDAPTQSVWESLDASVEGRSDYQQGHMTAPASGRIRLMVGTNVPQVVAPVIRFCNGYQVIPAGIPIRYADRIVSPRAFYVPTYRPASSPLDLVTGYSPGLQEYSSPRGPFSFEPPIATQTQHSTDYHEPAVEAHAEFELGLEGPSVALEQIGCAAAEDIEPPNDSPIQPVEDS